MASASQQDPEKLGWDLQQTAGRKSEELTVKVQERVGNFLAGLVSRKDEVKRRCRTVLQSKAESLRQPSQTDSKRTPNAHPTLALV